MIDFSSELNQEQLAVVYQGDGPCLVLAGAGSGKTRTITYRVAYLLEQGVAPDKIVATRFKTDGDPSSGVARTRPLCPYPQVARYKGSGSTDEASNFACAAGNGSK